MKLLNQGIIIGDSGKISGRRFPEIRKLHTKILALEEQRWKREIHAEIDDERLRREGERVQRRNKIAKIRREYPYDSKSG